MPFVPVEVLKDCSERLCDVVLPSKIGGWQQLETFEIQIERFPKGPIFEITIRYCSLEPVIAFDCSRRDNIA
jgi:hypothetical protein